ncbi:MAG: hypothetical protein ACOYJD_08370 [Christensenellales bacterium]|jgi:uncharacterized coiled-coil protein SlyX
MELRIAALEADVSAQYSDIKAIGREIRDMKNRIEKQDDILRQLQAMNANIAVISEQIKSLGEDMKETKLWRAAIDERPRQRWDVVIASIVSAIVGYIMAVLF